eukprot:g35486.t1
MSSRVARQNKASSSTTSTSARDNWSQEECADIWSQPWLCDQKTLLVAKLTKYPYLDKTSNAEDEQPDWRAPEKLLNLRCLAGDLCKRLNNREGEAVTQKCSHLIASADRRCLGIQSFGPRAVQVATWPVVARRLTISDVLIIEN